MDYKQGFDVEDKTGEKYEDELSSELIRQWEILSGDRGNWENQWTEIAERMYPGHKNLFYSLSALSSQGDKRNQYILDSTAVLALQRFGAILDSLLTPRNSYWHQLKPTQKSLMKDKKVMDWFSLVNTILFDLRYSSTANFASQNQLVYKSLGAYGTGALLIDDLAGKDGFRYKNIHLSELYIEENHQGIVDRVCRHFTMTARQAVEKFGKKTPECITAKLKQNPESPFYFLHWVIPRTDKDPDRKDFKGMDYCSYYISIEGKKLVSEGGYRVFPYAISRYEQMPQETFGRSPGMDALPAIKTLNKQKELVLKQGQLATDPVILVHDDGIMDGAQVEAGTYISGAITAAGQPLLQPLPAGRVDIGKDMMDDERLLINDTFLVNLFQILTETPEMTATEVMERAREKGILLAPTIGRQQSEYLGPMIEREIDLAISQGQLPPMPQALVEARGDYSIVYDSPITRTQKAEWASGAIRTIETLINYATQTGDSSPLDVINMDIAAPQIAEIYGTPSTWISSPERIAGIREQRAKQQQAQMAIEAAPAAAGIIKATR